MKLNQCRYNNKKTDKPDGYPYFVYKRGPGNLPKFDIEYIDQKQARLNRYKDNILGC